MTADRALHFDNNLSQAKDVKTDSLVKLGFKLFNKEKYEEAIKKFDDAIVIKPSEAAYHSYKSLALNNL